MEPAAVPALHTLVLVHDQGPGTDETHLAPQDVDELGQLIERGAPQKASDTRDARVVGELEQPAGLVEVNQLGLEPLGAVDHRAELDDREALAVAPDPRLPEEHGAARGQL